jgi:hypothetical protein
LYAQTVDKKGIQFFFQEPKQFWHLSCFSLQRKLGIYPEPKTDWVAVNETRKFLVSNVKRDRSSVEKDCKEL